MRAFVVAAILAASPAIAGTPRNPNVQPSNFMVSDETPAVIPMPICADGAVIGVRLVITRPVALAPQVVDLVPPASLCKSGDA